MKAKLVGFKRFKSKKGNECCVLSIEKPYTPAEQARGCHGSSVDNIFAPEDKIDAFTEKDLGKEVDLLYSIEYGRAVLYDVVFIG